MNQEKKDLLEGSERFEEGVLRADACAERHLHSRETEFRTPEEDLPEQSFGKSAYWEEQNLMKKVYRLRALGIKPHGSISLEQFVEAHQAKLEEAE